jgi:hypothetical protein
MEKKLHYTLLAFHFNALLDSGEVLDITETKQMIDQRKLFPWLKDKFANDIDISLFQPAALEEISDLFSNIRNVVDAKSKFGVEKNGLALLVAYCLEAIQQER